jgi:integrase
MPKKAKELSPLEVGRLSTAGFYPVGGVPGLALQVTESGARSWILRLTVGTRRRDMGLGGFPAVTLAQAREKARQARQKADEGEDPILARERARSLLMAEQSKAVTFEQAARKFIESKRAEWRNDKHAKQWSSTLELYAFPLIGPLHVADVGQGHILKILEPIWTTKTETATRLRGRLESVIDWATVKGHRSGENPARWRGHLDKLLPAPNKIARVVHHPAVPVGEAPAFYARLSEMPGIAARALQFAMLTAARSGEVRGATWQEIDLEAGMWVIPAERMKANFEHRVPLPAAALKLLKQTPRVESSEHVFPALKGGALSDMALTAVMRRMETAWVPHGLRSTFRDWVAERTEFPGALAEKALAHRLDNQTEAAYQRSDMVARRLAMMESWAGYLGGRTEGVPK